MYLVIGVLLGVKTKHDIMKKLKQFLAMAMLLVTPFFINSCDEEEKPAAPVVTTSASVANVVSGQSQTLTFSVTIPGGYKTGAIGTPVGGSAEITTQPAVGAKEGDVVVTFTAGSAAGAGSVTFTVTDNSNQTASATAVVNVTFPDGPTLTGSTSVTAAKINEAKDVTIPVTIPGGYKAGSATVTNVIGGTAVVKSAPAANATSGNIVVTFTAGNNPGAGSVQVNVTDNNNKSAFVVSTFNITLDAPPTLVLNKSTAQANAGATVSVQATITAANGGKQLSITGITSTPASPVLFTETSKVIDVTLNVPSNAIAGSKIVAVFVATDAKDLNTAPQSVEITVTAPNTIIVPAGALTQNTTWTAANKYVIQGQVFVNSGITLTIEPGTVVVGEKASKGTLIVKPGGILIAEGTPSNPIVFTSNQPVGARDRGDWGGIVWLGNAFVNQATLQTIEGITPSQTYGNNTSSTTNATENNGSLKYVRIEYAGIELSPNNETNSLTMGGLGNGTTLDYVQVSFGGDDGFEWFGGTANAKHLVSFSTWDDDFDTDFGWAGNVQYGVVVRNPFFADQSGSNAFESDNQGNGNSIAGCDATAAAAGTITSCTRGVFSNITVLGPRETNTRSISGSYQNAMHIRRRSSISVFNSFISGFRIGLRIDDDGTYFNLAQGNAVHKNNVLSNSSTAGTGTSSTATDGTYVTGIRFTAANDGTIDAALPSGGNAAPVANYWLTNNAAFNNITATTAWSDIGITPALFWAGQSAANYPSNPNFALGAGVAGNNNLNSGAAFTDAKLAGTFFETTTYRGAFGATDWTDGWSEFQPINKAY